MVSSRQTLNLMVLATVHYEIFPSEVGSFTGECGWHQLDGEVRLGFTDAPEMFISWGNEPHQYSVEVRSASFFSAGRLSSLQMSAHPYWQSLIGHELSIARMDTEHQILRLSAVPGEVFLSSQYDDGTFQGDCIRVSQRTPI